MPTQLLPIGPPTLMLAGVAYALPAVKCSLYTDATSPTLTLSNTQAFTANTAVTLTAGQATVVGGGFIKAAADTTVILKRD
jgi:hypothetical protein